MPSPPAQQVIALLGGAGNVAALTHCWARLRFTLRDDSLADETALADLPGVVMVIRQSGQLQVALRSGVVEAHAAVASALSDAGWSPDATG